MARTRTYTVEVLESHSDGTLSLVELVDHVTTDTAEAAVQAVIRGDVRSSYGGNYTRYGYRAYRRGEAGKHPESEYRVEVPALRGLPVQEQMQRAAVALSVADETHKASHEVVVGALRGLLECADMGDTEAESILRRIRNTEGANDDALRDALDLYQSTLEKWNSESARCRSLISKQEG